jgi:hypothetical protein
MIAISRPFPQPRTRGCGRGALRCTCSFAHEIGSPSIRWSSDGFPVSIFISGRLYTPCSHSRRALLPNGLVLVHRHDFTTCRDIHHAKHRHLLMHHRNTDREFAIADKKTFWCHPLDRPASSGMYLETGPFPLLRQRSPRSLLADS